MYRIQVNVFACDLSITVGDNKENPENGGVSINELPALILDTQSYEVDAISGATINPNIKGSLGVILSSLFTT